ncbi:hypothetical protein B0H14DRAFT_1472808 [Mycena olivaceomarginata]|nr:hypothetical protein B0H14DRAFT_1472808 [Mycena olivaceomarginata]
MAAPFVYVPEDSPSLPPHPFYSTPQSQSPFLPPAALYSPSPFSAPGTPENFTANSILWPDSAPSSPFEPPGSWSWTPLSNRQRTISWHGPAPPPLYSPFLSPAPHPAFLQSPAPSAGYFPPALGHRRASWGASGAPAPPPWATPPPAPPPPPQIHPFLNGDTPSPIFHLDLAPSRFAPQRLLTNPHIAPPQTAPLSTAELSEPAFHPPRTTLRILHPLLPFWPVDLALPPTASPLPISLGDVLISLHHALHTRIAHVDWDELSSEDAERVAQAFTRRCRAEAMRSGVPAAHLRDREVEERNGGVRRVDFLAGLGGGTVFRGLVREEEDPDGCVRVKFA